MTEIYSDIDQLHLCTHTYNILRRGGFHTCAQILRAGRDEVRKLHGIGPVAINEIATGLAVSQSGQWTEQGTPLPTLGPAAAQVVEALGLGDSPTIRQGLARVLRDALEEMAGIGGGVEVRRMVADLENGAR